MGFPQRHVEFAVGQLGGSDTPRVEAVVAWLLEHADLEPPEPVEPQEPAAEGGASSVAGSGSEVREKVVFL